MITKDILIEELVERYPVSVDILSKKGLVCIVCGEPVWGTLAELAASKGMTAAETDLLVKVINEKMATEP